MARRIVGIAFLLTVVSTSAFAQWTWLNPKPQGHTLNDVEFLDDETAIAVGDAGTILITHDGGLTWSTKTKVEGVVAALNRVTRVDNERAIVVGGTGVILTTHDAGVTWTQVASGTGATLEGVDFENGVAIAVGNGVMRRSIDGGMSWSPVSLGATYVLHAVDVVSASVAVAVANNFFLRSENGGVTWTASFILTNVNAIAFADELNGVIAWGNYYQFTDDGGQTWQDGLGPDLGSHSDPFANEIVLDGIENLHVAVSAGGCDGMMNCASFGLLLRSSNGAASWNYNYGSRPLRGLDRNSAGVALLVGDGGTIYRWSDPDWDYIGGSQYDPMDDSAIDFLDATTGIVVGSSLPLFQSNYESLFLRTSDTGASWTPKTLFYASITDVAYAIGTTPPLYALALEIHGGSSTRIFKSTDGGANWTFLVAAPALNAIEFQSATRGLAVGQNGIVAVIDNDVVTPATIPGAGNLYDVALADASVAVAVGGSGNPATSTIIRSTDGGVTWGPVSHTPVGALNGVAFSSATVGVALGAGGHILRTEDAGLTWSPVASPTTAYLSAVSFAGPYGMGVGNSGTVIETHDGGALWTAVASPTTWGLRDVECLGLSHAIMTSWELIVLEYRQTPLPTLISSFAGEAGSFAVNLSWSVRDEANLSEFRVERSDATTGRTFRHIAGMSRSFRDDTVAPGSTYQYTLVAVDSDGAEAYSAPIQVTTSPAELTLLPNVPNPFNPSTTIRYVLPSRERVRVTIYDVSGRPVATIVDREEAAGTYGVAWNGTDDAGSRVASGVYMVRIEAGKQSLSRKIVLLK